MVSFTCRIGSRTLHGVVKEKKKARKTYQDAVARGESAGLLEQFSDASDCFRTRLGNIPAGERVFVEITYVGELKQDAGVDGIRFTLPTVIAPRYGTDPEREGLERGTPALEEGGIEITVDAIMSKGSLIESIQSPTHLIAVNIGNLSTSNKSNPAMHQASVRLSLGTTGLDKDFVLIVVAIDTETPKALLETHSKIPDQRALMVTLVPKFSLPPTRPEIIFVIDRSGSMASNIPTLISALKVFLKSLPVGVMFNICSFGTLHSFLWPKSRAYNHGSLDEAMSHIKLFRADFGGTQTFKALKAAIENRCRDIPCEVMLLTDGQISNQTEIFSYLNEEIRDSQAGIRVFSLGIGDGISHALVEGIARAGNGFAQTVGEGEKLDKKIIRMLKGALSPHIKNFELEIEYEDTKLDDDDFEMVERVTDSLRVLNVEDSEKTKPETSQNPISFFDMESTSDTIEVPPSAGNDKVDPYALLPAISVPNLLQSPSTVPPLFSFSRTVVYIILSPETIQKRPKSVVLRGKSSHGPLRLRIPVEALSERRELIHQLAARRAIQELEENRGWIFDARDKTGALIKEKFPSRIVEIVEREAVRLGTRFQVAGKWCSFVAVSHDDNDSMENEWETGSSGSNDIHLPSPSSFGAPPTARFLPQVASRSSQYSESAFSDSCYTYGPMGQSTQSSLNVFRPGGALLGGVSGTGGMGSPSQVGTFGSSAQMTDTRHSAFGQDKASAPGRIFSAGEKRKRKATDSSVEIDGMTEKYILHRGGSSGALVTTGVAESATPKALSNSDTVDSIIEMQDFDGYWTMSKRLLALIDLDDQERLDPKRHQQTWVTILVVAYLETQKHEEEEVWELVVEKARDWLKGQDQALMTGWEEEARKLFLQPSIDDEIRYLKGSLSFLLDE